MKHIIITLAICLLAFQGMAQSIDRQVISSYGNLTSTTSATLGEVIIETKTVSGSFTLNQGFQQTNKKVGTSIKDVTLHIDYNLYPNPTTDVLNVELNTIQAASFEVYIVNALGQQVSPKTQVLIDGIWKNAYTVSDYAQGIYFFVLEEANGKKYKSMQFVKR